MNSRLMSLSLAFAALALAACHGHETTATLRPATPRPVSIEVEVYDPITNLVWEGVSVRVVEAYHEWSGCNCESPYIDWYLTDVNGRVFFDEATLAYAEVGFLEDPYGAVINPHRDQDEATVLLEIDAIGFAPVFVEVTLRWDDSDVLVEVPFY